MFPGDKFQIPIGWNIVVFSPGNGSQPMRNVIIQFPAINYRSCTGCPDGTITFWDVLKGVLKAGERGRHRIQLIRLVSTEGCSHGYFDCFDTFLPNNELPKKECLLGAKTLSNRNLIKQNSRLITVP